MNKTKIPWCTHTWNPVTGCRHDCPYCYARRISERFQSGAGLGDDCTQPGGGLHEIRRRSGSAVEGWRYGFAPTFHSHRINEPRWKKKSALIFVSSMGDLFGAWVPREWISQVLATVRACPQHTFIFLTKNPARYAEFEFPTNAWLGTTTESQAEVDERIPLLLQTPAAVRFVSLEPLLGPVDLRAFWAECSCGDYRHQHEGGTGSCRVCRNGSAPWDGCQEYRPWNPGLDWLIVGAETGPGARPCEPEWVEAIVAQARAAGVPVFVKGELAKQFPIQEYPKTGGEAA